MQARKVNNTKLNQFLWRKTFELDKIFLTGRAKCTWTWRNWEKSSRNYELQQFCRTASSPETCSGGSPDPSEASSKHQRRCIGASCGCSWIQPPISQGGHLWKIIFLPYLIIIIIPVCFLHKKKSFSLQVFFIYISVLFMYVCMILYLWM